MHVQAYMQKAFLSYTGTYTCIGVRIESLLQLCSHVQAYVILIWLALMKCHNVEKVEAFCSKDNTSKAFYGAAVSTFSQL